MGCYESRSAEEHRCSGSGLAASSWHARCSVYAWNAGMRWHQDYRLARGTSRPVNYAVHWERNVYSLGWVRNSHTRELFLSKFSPFNNSLGECPCRRNLWPRIYCFTEAKICNTWRGCHRLDNPQDKVIIVATRLQSQQSCLRWDSSFFCIT